MCDARLDIISVVVIFYLQFYLHMNFRPNIKWQTPHIRVGSVKLRGYFSSTAKLIRSQPRKSEQSVVMTTIQMKNEYKRIVKSKILSDFKRNHHGCPQRDCLHTSGPRVCHPCSLESPKSPKWRALTGRWASLVRKPSSSTSGPPLTSQLHLFVLTPQLPEKKQKSDKLTTPGSSSGSRSRSSSSSSGSGSSSSSRNKNNSSSSSCSRSFR